MFKVIKDFPNYTIQSNGAIYNRKTGRTIAHCDNGTGYKVVYLHNHNDKRKTKLVHRLLLENFVGPCPDGMEACHNNGIKRDNRLSNLRWGTRSANELDKHKHSTMLCGEKHQWSKLNESNVKTIRYLWRNKLYTQHQIADMYNVDHANISAIVLRKSWKHI